ncbi:MAG: ribonuclease R [Firmicutes bacterium]|jgi:ribonuclease R|nr:ribonuclease R [Bacillota bacterium]
MEYDDIDKNEMMEQRKLKIQQYLESKEYIPMKRKDICTMLSVPKEDRQYFEQIVNELLEEGKAVETKKGKLMSPKALNMEQGTFLAHSKGFGFVEREQGEDIFIPANQINGAMHKDKVLYRINRKEEYGKRAEGEIVKILKRGNIKIVGTFEQCKGFGFVLPDNKRVTKDIFISKENSMGAVTGHKVVAEITVYGDETKNPEGEIIEILGHINDPGVDILSIIREYDLPVDFPEDVYKQIENLEMEVLQKDREGREDFTGYKTVTIDGEDAKDLDDAISLDILENGNFLLGVHIADVSHYVRENTPLDKEAYKRGTSVYLVDRVIPMLPHKLSNGICSLNPHEDRLALSCIMEINHKAEVVNHRVVKSVIHSDKRMTYTAVREVLEEKTPALLEEYADFVDMLENMNRLRILLAEKRKKRGSVNFDLPESKIILDENGKPIDIKPYERSIATNMIEEFMLICNEIIAEDFFWQEVPFLFRSHEIPDEQKLQKMEDFIRNFGYHLKGSKDDIHPKAIQQMLLKAEGKDEERIITRVVLRSMKQARYTAENGGHFGLAAKYYCHFTSPIRRYPDLQIHRIIKWILDGQMTEKKQKSLNKVMPDVAKQCSMRERTAEDAERATDDLKKAEYMADKIGMEYEGIISSLTSWGIYVELPNTVEGMVPLQSLEDDFYIYDEENMIIYGEHSNKKYMLGQKVNIIVTKVDIELKNIDFVFCEQ